jgi:hypothetical protein
MTATKMIVIETCNECPRFHSVSDTEFKCLQSGKTYNKAKEMEIADDSHAS